MRNAANEVIRNSEPERKPKSSPIFKLRPTPQSLPSEPQDEILKILRVLGNDHQSTLMAYTTTTTHLAMILTPHSLFNLHDAMLSVTIILESLLAKLLVDMPHLKEPHQSSLITFALQEPTEGTTCTTCQRWKLAKNGNSIAIPMMRPVESSTIHGVTNTSRTIDCTNTARGKEAP